MYSNSSKIIATGVVSLALLAAAPVFADSESGSSDNGLHLGVFARILKDTRDDRREERREAREERTEARKDASANESTAHEFTIRGKVTFVSGTTLTVQGAQGAVYTVNAANASVTGHNNTQLTLSSIATGDTVKVTGSLSGSVIVATKIKDTSDLTGKVIRAVNAGVVTAINGTTVLFDTFGASGTSSATVNANTKYVLDGEVSSSSALKAGSHVIIAGTSTATGGTLNASIILILTEGFGWLMNVFR